MPMSVKTVAEINAMNPVELMVATGAATVTIGFVAFTKKIGLWEKFSPTERREAEALDAEMPKGFWSTLTKRVSTALMAGHKVAWDHGEWDVRTTANGSQVIVTPMLDENTDVLV